jgi:hypothetical protein
MLPRNGLWVPVCSFVLALLLSIMAGPKRLVVGRTFQDTTNKPCNVTVTCDPQECTFFFDPAALPNATAADLKQLAGDALKQCENSLGCAKVFGKNYMTAQVQAALQAIKDGPSSGQTVVTGLAAVSIKATQVNKAPDKGGIATVSLCTVALALVPTTASQNLKDHEAGHQSIHKHYRCDNERKYFEVELNKAACAMTFKDTGEMERFLAKQLGALIKGFEAPAPGGVGPEKGYQNKYDGNTHDGTDDGETASANAINGDIDNASHTAFPSDF